MLTLKSITEFYIIVPYSDFVIYSPQYVDKHRKVLIMILILVANKGIGISDTFISNQI